MKKFQKINLFIYLNALLIIDFLPNLPTKIFAKDLKKIYLTEININSTQFEKIGMKMDIDISTGSFAFGKVIEDLKSNGMHY